MALVAAAGVVGVPAARAEEPAKLDVVEEMAGAMGFANSHSPGFWEALTQAVADQRAAAEDKAAADLEKAAAERAEQARQMIADAARFGRRLEEIHVGSGMTSFTEYIPPASGDWVNEKSLVRIGTERIQSDGKVAVLTTYYHGGKQLGVVESVKENGVETVTSVREYERGSFDVKVGDTRPIPPPGSSANGKKPHTIDPKADGSLGRAGGYHPDAPAEIAHTDKTPRQQTVVRDKVELAGGGSRVEFEPIKLPDGRVIKPFGEVKPGSELPFREGYVLERPDFDGAALWITVYFDKNAKLGAFVGSMIKDGLETIVTVREFTPGSLGGLKKGDTRTLDDLGGKNPSTWEPKPPPGNGSGAKSGSKQSTGSTPQNGSAAPSNDGRTKPEPAPDGDGDDSSPSSDGDSSPSSDGDSSPSGDTTTGEKTKSSSGDSHPQYEFLGAGPKRENADGSTSQNTVHKRTEDGVLVQTITTTQKDGTQSQEQHCYKDSEEVACGGMTDEPTCRSNCDHLAVIVWLFGCTGPECETLPQEGPEHHCDQPGNNSETAAGGQDDSHYESSGSNVPHCPGAERPGEGAPADYGNPYDPDAPDPPDADDLVDPRDDGVTDPADPGEGEGAPGPVATLDDGGTTTDLGGSLRDPLDPWTENPAASGDGPPTTGDAERIPIP